MKPGLGLIVLAVACAVLIANAPLHGEFLWSESPRNALNGAFILDLLKERPVHDPVGWATAYYLRYPALTILFYPPFLYVVLALFYAVFGVSHLSAMVCLGAFAFALATGIRALAGRIASPAAALAAALLMLAAPETIQWGQQVMLEIPMLALVTWGAVFLLRYGDHLREGRSAPWTLVAGLMLLVLAAYTKQSALFIAIGLAAGLLVWLGPRRLLTRPHVWLITLGAGLALVPLVLMQLRFGAFNVTSVVSRPDIGTPGRLQLAGLTWYAMRLPEMLGWPTMLLALATPVLAALRRQWSLKRGETCLLLGWLVASYVALTLIDLKETRHGMLLMVPLVVLTAAALDQLLPRPAWRLAGPGAAALGFAVMVWWMPVQGATGYHEAAALVGKLAPRDGRIVFSGNHDGFFVFNVRALADRRDLAVVRADKLFLDITIQPELGLNPRQMEEEQVAGKLNRIGISYVVAVPDQWTEAPVMKAFQAVLESGRFTEVARLPVTGPVGERVLVVYRNNGPLADPPEPYGAALTAANVTLGH